MAHIPVGWAAPTNRAVRRRPTPSIRTPVKDLRVGWAKGYALSDPQTAEPRRRAKRAWPRSCVRCRRSSGRPVGPRWRRPPRQPGGCRAEASGCRSPAQGELPTHDLLLKTCVTHVVVILLLPLDTVLSKQASACDIEG